MIRKLNIWVIILTAITGLFLNSCETDFDINADWKEFTVVYGLLDQSEKDQYIRISKAFLGDGNVLTMAANPDSTSYGGNLEVWVEEWTNNSMSYVWYLDTVTIFNKENGVFSSPKQLLYHFHADTLYENAIYKLSIKNKISGKLITGETRLVKTFGVSRPFPNQSLNLTATSPLEIKWTTSENGMLYQVEFVVHYTETYPSSTTEKSLNWNLGTYSASNALGGEVLTADFLGQNFFKFLHDNIPVCDTVVRSLSSPPLELIFSVGSEDFNTYIEVNSVSNTINQEKPQYTNVSNGIGLFSSRFHKVQYQFLTAPSLDSLKNGSFTKDLNFQ